MIFKTGHLNFVFFSFVGDASSHIPPLPHDYPMTRHALRERTQLQSYFEENPKNEDIDIQRVLSDPSHRFYVFRRFRPN